MFKLFLYKNPGPPGGVDVISARDLEHAIVMLRDKYFDYDFLQVDRSFLFPLGLNCDSSQVVSVSADGLVEKF